MKINCNVPVIVDDVKAGGGGPSDVTKQEIEQDRVFKLRVCVPFPLISPLSSPLLFSPPSPSLSIHLLTHLAGGDCANHEGAKGAEPQRAGLRDDRAGEPLVRTTHHHHQEGHRVPHRPGLHQTLGRREQPGAAQVRVRGVTSSTCAGTLRDSSTEKKCSTKEKHVLGWWLM